MIDVIQATDLNADAGARWRTLYSRKLEVETVQAFGFVRSHGLEPILIKGWAAARNYPQDLARFYTDIDFAVPAADFERARAILSSSEGERIAVDLHRELRHLDTKPWDAIFEDSEIVRLDGCDIRIPSAEDHLRVLAVHWMNDGGEKKDRLWDIYYAVANRPESFDWNKCLNAVSPLRREWIIAAIGLTHRYLGLPIEDLPFADQAKDLPAWLIATVEKEWKSGVRHRSLHTCMNDPAEFLRQLRKRIPPNPLQSTIESEGDLRKGIRLKYQLQSMKKRFLPSLRGLTQKIRLKAG